MRKNFLNIVLVVLVLLLFQPLHTMCVLCTQICVLPPSGLGWEMGNKALGISKYHLFQGSLQEDVAVVLLDWSGEPEAVMTRCIYKRTMRDWFIWKVAVHQQVLFNCFVEIN